MKYEMFYDFVEFKNTKEGKKVDVPDAGSLTLNFRKIKQGKFETVRIGLNPGLVQSMKENKIFSFKLLFNETNLNVCLRYDNSSNAFTIVNKASRAGGSHDFYNKYVSATMLKVLADKKARSSSYKGKYVKDKLAYLFVIDKVNKDDK